MKGQGTKKICRAYLWDEVDGWYLAIKVKQERKNERNDVDCI